MDIEPCNEIANIDLNDSEDYEVDHESETQWKMMTSEEYKNIVQLIPQMEKYRHSIIQMKNVIESQDIKIKELERIQKYDCVNVSKLSDVSYSILTNFVFFDLK